MIEAEMYGMIPSAKIVTLARLPPENMSTRPNQLPRFCSKKSMRACGVDPGRGDVVAQAVDGQQAEGEQHPLPEVRDVPDVPQALQHGPSALRLSRTSALPPSAGDLLLRLAR